jgi:hypothetical protein
MSFYLGINNMINEIEASIEKSFRLSNLTDLSSDIGEVALDAFLKDGLLKEIPLVGTILKVAQLGMNIRDVIYLKKILRFIFNFEDTSETERIELIRKFDLDAKASLKFGEYLTTLLENIDSFEKADYVAKAFKAYLLGNIVYTELLRINHGISQLLLVNVKELTAFYEIPKYVIDESALQNLGNSGFILISSSYGGMLGPTPSLLGEKFLIHILNRNIELRAEDIKKRNEENRNKNN